MDVDLHEVLDHGPALVARVAVGADGADDRGDAVAGEQVRDEPDPKDVRVAVLAGEPEPLRQVRANHVAVQQLDLLVAMPELVEEHLRERRLAGPGEAGEPDRDAAFVEVIGHDRKLLPTAPSGAPMP
jgi:hypothetical protein